MQRALFNAPATSSVSRSNGECVAELVRNAFTDAPVETFERILSHDVAAMRGQGIQVNGVDIDTGEIGRVAKVAAALLRTDGAMPVLEKATEDLFGIVESARGAAGDGRLTLLSSLRSMGDGNARSWTETRTSAAEAILALFLRRLARISYMHMHDPNEPNWRSLRSGIYLPRSA